MDWDKRHASTEAPTYGDVPSGAVTYALAYFKRGPIVDLGCGDGRNAIYLAQRSFDVVGIDSSRVAIEKLLRFAAEKKVEDKVRGVVSDFTDFNFGHYDNAISTLSIHCLPKARSQEFLKRLVDGTPVGGVNVIVGFLNFGPFYEAMPDLHGHHFFEQGELKEIYRGWEIVDYPEEEIITTRSKDKDGKNYKQPASQIIARKIARA